MYRQEASAVRRIGHFADHKGSARKVAVRMAAAAEAVVRKLAPAEVVGHTAVEVEVVDHMVTAGEAAARMIAVEEVHIAAEEGVVEQTCSVPEPDLRSCRKLCKTVRRQAAELRNLGILP